MVLRIGLIGSGIVTAKAHIPAIIRDPRFRITALCRRNPENLQNMRKQFPGAAVFSSADQLIESGLVDCVLVAADVTSHLEISQMVVDNGLYGLIEKPIGQSSLEIQEFIDSNKNGIDRLMVAFNKRFYPGILKFDQLRSDEKISPIIGGTLMFLTKQGRKGGRGGILQNLIHTCDLACHIFGPAKDVQAQFSSALNDLKRGKTISASILTDRGCAVSLFFTSSSNWNIPIHERIEIVDDRSRKFYIEDSDRVLFSHPTAEGTMENSYFRESNSIFWRNSSFGYEAQISAFGDLIEGKGSGSVPTFHNALKAQDLFEGIFNYDK